MRHSKVGPENLHSLRVSDETRDKSRRKREDFGLDAIAVEGDGPGHTPL
jgi:hypothetical protein